MNNAQLFRGLDRAMSRVNNQIIRARKNLSRQRTNSPRYAYWETRLKAWHTAEDRLWPMYTRMYDLTH